MKIIERKMSNEFTKFIAHLPEINLYPAFHHFTAPDVGLPHSHPWNFKSTIVRGGYVEHVYLIQDDKSVMIVEIERKVGDIFEIEANHIHKIVKLLGEDCVTMVIAEPATEDVYFYDFREDGNYRTKAGEGKFEKM